MKKTIAWILVLALLSVASVLGTIAYLTDEDYAENIMTIGNVDIDLLEYERVGVDTSDGDAVVQEFRDNKPLLPAVIEKGFDYTPGDTYVDWTQDAVEWQQQNDDDGYTSPIWDPAKINNEVDKMVFVRNNGDYGAYVRIYFAFEAGNFDTFNEFREMIHLNLNETGDWEWEWIPFLATNDEGGKYFIANATYKKELMPDDFTDITLSQIALDSSATNEQVEAFGDTYEVFVNAQGIQSAGFKDPDTALDEGFGRDIPFEKLTLVAGIDLKTALHNLNGDDSKPITSKVATVTFGLNETYPNIVKDNVGTFTSVEQDAEVYTYYVPNATDASKYDVYVLADATIYTPKISKGLFRGMTSLATVDTANMDVSRTEDMQAMFRDCHVLTSIDVSNWDVSNVSTMKQAFLDCKQLSTIDVSEWDLSGATNLNRMFYGCPELTYLDVSDWETGNVTDMMCLFYDCVKLNNLDVSDWDVSNVTDMSYTFMGCHALTSLDVDEWDVGNVVSFEAMFSCANEVREGMMLTEINLDEWDTSSATNMRDMFYGCAELMELDLSKWDVSNVTDMHHMFTCCKKIETINLSGWDTSSLLTMNGMFHSCLALKTIDVSDFDTQNVTDMDQVFESCLKIEQIIGLENWDTSNVTSMSEMFYHCGQYGTNGIYGGNLQVLDLSSFNTSQVINTERMFNCCDRLQTIYVGDGWDMSKVTNSDGMFGACGALVGGANTAYSSAHTDATYARVDTPENPGYFTYKAAESTTPEQN